MALVGDLELASFDYTDPDLKGERFHTAMKELAAEGWLAAGPYGYVVFDREAGEFFLRTRSAIFPGMKIAELFEVTEGPLWEEMKRNILHINGADHTRLRSLVNPSLSPRAVERWRGAMRGFLEGLFASVESAGRCEFVEAFAKPYPSQTIATVMGAPLEDAPRLHHWSTWIQRQFDAASMADERAGIEQAVAEFYEYAHALLATRRDTPGDDLISTLLAAEEQGDKLSEEECVNLVLNVLIGVSTRPKASSPTRSACLRSTPTSGPPWWPIPPWLATRSRRLCATSRSPLSPPASRLRSSPIETSPFPLTRSSWCALSPVTVICQMTP